MDWQDIVVWAILAAIIAYTAWRIVGAIKGVGDGKSGCDACGGGCSSCNVDYDKKREL